MTADEALANAIRLYRAAEMETNLALMERLEKLGDSWVGLASTMRSYEWTLDEATGGA